MQYKVYVDYTTEDVPRPFYVGKGKDRRIRLRDRNELHRRISEKYGIDRRVIFETDDENEAFAQEIALIAEYKTCIYAGNDHWGANFTLGGEGTSGNLRPDQYGDKHPMWGKHHTEESKRKNSKSNKISTAGEKNGMYGKHHSEETKKKIGEKSRGHIDSEETRRKKSEAAKRSSSGRKLSEETKHKIAEAHRGKVPWNKGKKLGKRATPRVFSKQARKNISEGCKGRIPWNKGHKQSS